MSNYQNIRKFIKDRLQVEYEKTGYLKEERISAEIESFCTLLNASQEVIMNLLSLEDPIRLHEEDWERMENEFEKHFNVYMDEGLLIQGDDQKEREIDWWSNQAKMDNELFYWKKYKEMISSEFPPKVTSTIDKDTDIILDNAGDPRITRYSRYGMVVGHVQSGKTANYAALISKACDSGYKFIVVIAGCVNNLRNQTQVRINKSIIGRQAGRNVGVGHLGNYQNSMRPCSLTTEKSDFNRRDADQNSQAINFDNIKVPIIMVIKKNTHTLTNVINWLKAQNEGKIREHAMLLIDDESDYASINTNPEEDPTTINRKLRQLLSIFEKSSYVAYTATPFANIFIDYRSDDDDLGRDLFPKDYIYRLKRPTNYVGPEECFLKEKVRVITVEDNEDYLPVKHKRLHDLTSLPPSLEEAVRLFLINIAIRFLREKKMQNNSMLIHVSRFTRIHIEISWRVKVYLERFVEGFSAFGCKIDPEVECSDINLVKETFNKHYKDLDIEWCEVCKGIVGTCKNIVVREVHSEAHEILNYPDGHPISVIAIGGTSLSRGYTLEGLCVSYFLRTTKMYDTLMQMGRWFGYRDGYEDLCAVYMSDSMIRNFTDITKAVEDLYDDFEKMYKAGKTPEEFGLSVKQYPESALQITARNKARNAKDFYFDMRLDGLQKETSWISNDVTVNMNNIQLIEALIGLLCKKYADNKKEGVENLWTCIPNSTVVDFLGQFEVYTKNPFYALGKMPIDFIRKYAQDVDVKWDVLIASGKSKHNKSINGFEYEKPYRTITPKDDYFEFHNRQVAQGAVEKVVFPKNEIDQYSGSGKRMREKMDRPLLVLYIVDPRSKKGVTGQFDIRFPELAAFGISFPGGVTTDSKVITSKINSVYIDQLMREEEISRG